MPRRPPSVVVAIAAALACAAVLASCSAAPVGGGGNGGFGASADPGPLATSFDPVIPAPGEVLGQATVLQVDGGAAEFCLGGVADSYPPQCDGPELVGWDWAAVDDEQTADGVMWGEYAVTGTWDGERMTPTAVVPLARFDPPPTPADPRLDATDAGVTSEARLLEIQRDLHRSAPFPALTSSPQNGYLFVTVVYDDGRIQALVDEAYGSLTVVIGSALRDR